MNSNWYVIRTKAQSERIAEEHLLRQGYEVYLPRTFADTRGKPSRAIQPLFPRYVFIQLSEADNWSPIRSTRGVAYLLCFGNGDSRRPAVVQSGVIERLIERETSEGVHGLARDYEPGDEVWFNRWYRMVVKASKGERIVLMGMMFGTEREIETTRKHIAPRC